MERYIIKTYGQVQGVSFRVNARNEANILNLTGFVKNEPDGSVYIEVEGQTNDLKKFLVWCHNGPAHADISSVTFTAHNLAGYKEFLIK